MTYNYAVAYYDEFDGELRQSTIIAENVLDAAKIYLSCYTRLTIDEISQATSIEDLSANYLAPEQHISVIEL